MSIGIDQFPLCVGPTWHHVNYIPATYWMNIYLNEDGSQFVGSWIHQSQESSNKSIEQAAHQCVYRIRVTLKYNPN